MLPESTRRALERHGGQARIYLVGPGLETADLSRYGTIQRVVAWDRISAAIAVAEYRDEAADAGWSLEASRSIATHNFVLANGDDPMAAVAGLSLGRFGKFGPLLWVERDRIPPATEQYLWKMRPEFFVTPAEGPFNHLRVLGDVERISMTTQAGPITRRRAAPTASRKTGYPGWKCSWWCESPLGSPVGCGCCCIAGAVSPRSAR